MALQQTTLTDEDRAIMFRVRDGRLPVVHADESRYDDKVDFRAMLARLRWRGCWLHANTSAAQAVDLELSTGRTMRELYEANNSFAPLA